MTTPTERRDRVVKVTTAVVIGWVFLGTPFMVVSSVTYGAASALGWVIAWAVVLWLVFGAWLAAMFSGLKDV